MRRPFRSAWPGGQPGGRRACEASMAAIGYTGPGRVLWALDMQVFLPGIYLAGSLLLASAILSLVKRWRQRVDQKAPDASDQLAHFRALYEQGAMSEEEFNQVRAVLGVQLRHSLSLPRPAESAP